MNPLETLAARLRDHTKLRDFPLWGHLRRLYPFGLRVATFNRGLSRTLYPGVVARVSYASRQTMEANFNVTLKWDVPCLDLIHRWIEANRDICFFDVGANHGQFALVVSRWLDTDSTRIVAFEPHPGNRQVLAENLARNGCKNVEVVNCALAAEAGTMTLYGASVSASLQPDLLREGTQVNVDTLDGFCARTGLEPMVVKIDVEGFELEVLRGAVETLSRYRDSIKIICEMHTFMWEEPDYDLRLIELVESCGLLVFGMDGRRVNRINDYGHYVLARHFA
ncbi:MULTISPECIES: FkbM family methyltransferase [unclassified Thiocapsa]|uniref:FkbM family methyltransferase n=1 Tax=unclassified Thiocapsa TaxID=2641286 RepID=UPI0035B23BF8